PQRRRQWEAVVRALEPDRSTAAIMLILDVKTRWSSTHQMLRRALSYRDSVNMYVRKDCAVGGSGALRNYIMDDDDWKAIELVASRLKIFRHATVQMSRTKKPMLSTTHAVFRGLQAELKDTIANLPVEIDLSLHGSLVHAHWKLNEYFYKFDQSEYCSWACRTCLLAKLGIGYIRQGGVSYVCSLFLGMVSIASYRGDVSVLR
ncbi:hypothetical protein DFH08DRAFT_724736, partial [Mycena albidolilacea]